MGKRRERRAGVEEGYPYAFEERKGSFFRALFSPLSGTNARIA
jgi:hypothetical protein